MTLEEVLVFGIRRSGLSVSSTEHRNRAREYFNLGKDDISSRHRWRWLRERQATVTTTADDRTTELASDVLYPLKFWNKTDNRSVEILLPDRTYDLDPDDATTGPVGAVGIAGLGPTGYWEVEWTNIPDTTGDAILYSYIKAIADKTLDNDSTSLATDMPLWVQQSLIFYVSARLKGHYGDAAGESQDEAIYERRVAEAVQNDQQIDGNIRHRMGRRRVRGTSALEFSLQSGTL